MYDGKDAAKAASCADLIRWLFVEPNPISLNTALAMGGVIQPVFRLPYYPLSKAQREEGVRLINALGLAHFPSFKHLRAMDDAEFRILEGY